MKAPLRLREAPDAIVREPLLAIARGPPLVVPTVLLKVNAAPVKLIPGTFTAAKAPLKVLVPVPDN